MKTKGTEKPILMERNFTPSFYRDPIHVGNFQHGKAGAFRFIMSDYKKLLLDPRWQRKKSEIQIKYNFICQSCAIEGKSVHVHHNYYLKNRKPWEYEDDCFSLLCEECHAIFHKEQDELKEVMRLLSVSDFSTIKGFIKGIKGLDVDSFSCFEEAEGYLKGKTQFAMDRVYKMIEEVKGE